jgi:hypothetical protein
MILQSLSFVVLANLHNPSILNHDFLKINGIVTDAWGSPKDFLSTPPLASILYPTVRTRVVCQEQRLQFDLESPTDSAIDAIAAAVRQYVEILKHVKYTAFGLNLSLVLPSESVEGIVARFATERLRNAALPPFEMDVVFRVRGSPSRSTTIQFAKGLAPDQGPGAIVVNTNSHFDLALGLDDLLQLLSKHEQVRSEAQQLAAQFWGK